LGWAPLPST
jgi:hypothetical protein